MNINNNINIKSTLFNYIALIIAAYWLIDSSMHYFLQETMAFELIPSDSHEFWERIFITILLLIIFNLSANFTSNALVARTVKRVKTENIYRAKKQWELVVDSLPQLIIAMDENSRITRINRTVEKWGAGKVNKVDGLYVADFLKCLNTNFSNDTWLSDWPKIWQDIQSEGTIERVIEKDFNEKIYRYTLKKVPDYDPSKDLCYAILVIDDITVQHYTEISLKDRAEQLEKIVNNRTKDLKHANSQLEVELLSKQSINEKLEHAEKCRVALLRDIFSAQENERKRIAHELHDSASQSLGATKFKLEGLLIDENNDKNADYEKYSPIVKNLQSILDEIRHISMDLRPAMLDDLGTLITLDWFCREFENTYSGISIDKIIDVDELSISEENKIVIFRIVQESMNNIVKHAGATKISLEISSSSSGMTMCISDNGCGFDYENAIKRKINGKSHPSMCAFGLNSMRERAESTNGIFSIRTIPDVGTCVQVRWENQNQIQNETPLISGVA